MQTVKKKILLVQLGSPESPSTSDVRKFLREFLGDPRVVDLPRFFWSLILNLFVLPFRPKKSAKAYARIWDGKEFPLPKMTKSLASKVNQLTPDHYEVAPCFLVCSPRPLEILTHWSNEPVDDRAKELYIFPQFPQYAESTIASATDVFFKATQKAVNLPQLSIQTSWHRAKIFIDHSVKNIEKIIREKGSDYLVLSFHGIPTRRVIQKNDQYYRHCYETFKLIKERIKGVSADNIEMTFQSRFGSEEWLGPYTDERVRALILEDGKKVAIYPAAFLVDCLETTDELGSELAEELGDKEEHLHLVPCLNDSDEWAKAYAGYVMTMIEGSASEKRNLEYDLIDKEITLELPEQKMKSPPLSDHAKTSIKTVFLLLFLDLVGFSIIFPLFPALAKYYLALDSENFFLRSLFDIATFLSPGASIDDPSSIVLFGGLLGALYSLLQFLFAPFWGALSDRIGRKPVLLYSLIGLFISYVLWVVSGSFTILILARFIGGVMAGNISTATAVVADVTDKSNRAKGMALVGIAFALGFIIGPAMGGVLSLVDLTKMAPSLTAYGINPFSMPALVACVLTAWNIFYLIKNFKETLPPEKRGKLASKRSANPFLLLRPLPFKGVNLVNFGHFIFLMAFSGMEFTLTFLAVERLSYTPLQNGYMFIYIGFLIALIQGGYVRRKASQIGEKRMALQGLALIIPGLLIISQAASTPMLYFGLFFLAVGSSMTIPCLTALVSIYTAPEHQGMVIGIFRSLGALARVIGPLSAALIYWKYGSATPYFIGSAIMIFSILLISRLPNKKAA